MLSLRGYLIFYSCFILLSLQVNIVGKCRICSIINQERKKSNVADSVREALSQAHLMHSGGFFMKERLQYQAVVRRQALYPEKVCSLHKSILVSYQFVFGHCFSGIFYSY